MELRKVDRRVEKSLAKSPIWEDCLEEPSEGRNQCRASSMLESMSIPSRKRRSASVSGSNGSISHSIPGRPVEDADLEDAVHVTAGMQVFDCCWPDDVTMSKTPKVSYSISSPVNDKNVMKSM